MRVLIINGANLNLTGQREQNVYGIRSFDDYLVELRATHAGVTIDYFQSNIEGEIVDMLQKASGFDVQVSRNGGMKNAQSSAEITQADAIILNAGGYTHTSVVIRDAIAAIKVPVVEVHVSNTAAREEFRRTSLIAPVCVGSVAGFGLYSYEIGLLGVLKILKRDTMAK